MLDYKIKELKKDIAPREQEIMNLKMDTNKMDKKLREFNKTNAKLGYLVDSLRGNQKKMQKMIKMTRVKIQTNQIYIRTFENAVYWVAQEIDDFDKLKRAIQKNLLHYVKDQQFKQQEFNEEIKKEDEAQLKFLKAVGDNLNAKIEKQLAVHQEDHKANMKANSELIAQILKLRNEVRKTRDRFKERGGDKLLKQIIERETERENAKKAKNDFTASSYNFENEAPEVQKEVLKRREYISELK